MFEVAPSLAGLRAPDFKGGGPWLNSRPLSMADLRGKVVLIDFFAYSCVNCLRTLPYVRRWHDRYSDAGLVVVGLHTPEFDFERHVENVAAFARRRSISYPIVLDNDQQIWRAYGNRYWPHRYLIDARGIIRYDHDGEGGYPETEAILRTLLAEAHPGVLLPPFDPAAERADRRICLPATSEMYCGFFKGTLGNPEGFAEERIAEYHDSGRYENSHLYLHGVWEACAEYVRHARTTFRPADYVGLCYQAFEVNAVLRELGGTPVRVEILRDGRPLPAEVAGRDVRFDGVSSYVEVVEPRLYNLISDHHFGAHDLRLACASDQLAVYTFTFGGCSSDIGEEL